MNGLWMYLPIFASKCSTKKISKAFKGHNVRIGVGGGVREYLLPAILDSRNFLASSDNQFDVLLLSV